MAQYLSENNKLKPFNQLVTQLTNEQGRTALLGMLRGVEREALRIDQAGHLATDAHPKALGSALTHSRITTDYSEALLEFITPVENNIEKLLQGLTKTHAYTIQNLQAEQLWPVSMPCYIGDTKDIPIAQYGSSNIGKMKTLYRKGLTYRYGALMQIISGVHFNFSVSQSLWDLLYAQSDKKLSREDFVSESYFGMIRNYRRLVWVLPYLFGASPALCSSFIKNRPSDLPFENTGIGTLYLPYATSLRMSDLGYTNQEQEKLSISYNSLNEYLAGMQEAIKMPSASFAQIGVKVDGEYRQLNDYVLQIENEFYSPIRAKRVTKKNEMPSEALARGGVEYIEVRALDVNPFSPVGIEASQIRFLDLFLLYCLLSPSAAGSNAENAEVSANLKSVVLEGRKPGLMLMQHGEERPLQQWLSDLFAAFKPLAKLLDGQDDDAYQQALKTWSIAVDNPEKTISGQMMEQIISQGTDHGYWVMDLAKRYAAQLQNYPLSEQDLADFKAEAASSIQAQKELEQQSSLDFETYLHQYLEH